jgi:DNA-directed RNA polymerase specialized sigma24 family protein
MTLDLSVTRWIGGVRAGDADAVRHVWEAYFPRMVELARRRLQGLRRAADEEDVALSAFKSFWGGARAGRFPNLTDRHALWPLLFAITAHKCVDLIRRENRQKRGGPDRAGAEPQPADVHQVAGREPGPDFALQVAEESERLLTLLDRTGDSSLRPIARGKMDGESAAAIAARLGCVRRTVERKLQLIASIWERELQDYGHPCRDGLLQSAAAVADAAGERGV